MRRSRRQIQAIEDKYNRELLELDQRRLEAAGPARARVRSPTGLRSPTSGSSVWRSPAISSATPRLPPAKCSNRGPRRRRLTPWPIWSRSSPRPTAGGFEQSLRQPSQGRR